MSYMLVKNAQKSSCYKVLATFKDYGVMERWRGFSDRSVRVVVHMATTDFPVTRLTFLWHDSLQRTVSSNITSSRYRRTTKGLIRLRCVGWSSSSLFALVPLGTDKRLVETCACAGWYESACFGYVRKHLFDWHDKFCNGETIVITSSGADTVSDIWYFIRCKSDTISYVFASAEPLGKSPLSCAG